MNNLLEPEVEVLPREEPAPKSQLATVVAQSGLDLESAQSLQAAFSGMFEQAEEWRAKAAAINVTDVTQVSEMKAAREARLELRKIRVAAEHKRKELKEDSLRRGKAIDGINNILKFLIEPIEEHLLQMEQFAERKEAERLALLETERADALRPWLEPGAPMQPNLSTLSDDVFSALLEGTKKQFEDRRKAERKAERERIAAEKAAEAERKRIQEENARLKAEADAAAEALRLEREAAEAARIEQQRIADAKLAEEQERARIEREKIEEAARIEREAAEAIAERERARAAELEAQRQAELEAERQRQAEEAEALRKAAAAPDKEKLLSFAKMLRSFAAPVLVTSEANEIFDSFVTDINNAINDLEIEAEKL